MRNLLILVLRVLVKQKKLFVFLIISLSVSMSLIILTSGYLAREHSCDRYQTNYNRIFRLINIAKNEADIESKFYNTLISSFPSIDKVCRLYISNSTLSTIDRNVKIKNLVIVDSTFFDVFDYQILSGNKFQLVNAPGKIVLSQSLAKKIFGNENPLGKTIQINKKTTAYVTGVFADNNKKSHFKTDAVVSLYTKELPWTGGTFSNNKGKWEIRKFSYYITIKDQTDLSSLEEQVNSQYTESWNSVIPRLIAQPLSDIYWNNEIDDHSDQANIDLINLLISITIIIVIIASINYINLSLSNLKTETKIVSVFKVMGAKQKNMLRYYSISGILVFCSSFIIATTLAFIALPYFNQLLLTNVSLSILYNFKYLFPFVGFIIVLFLIMGIYPSLLFSGINPINIFRGNVQGKLRLSSISRVLIIFQFTIVIVLISIVLLIFKQINFMKNKNPGFDTSYLISQGIHYSLRDNNEINTYSEELLKNPNILNLSGSFGIPQDIYMYSGGKINGFQVSMLHVDCDTGFINLLGINLIEGRLFLPSDNNCCIITKKLAMDCGFEEPLKEKISDKQIIGILNDIDSESLRKNIKGTMFSPLNVSPSHLTIKISALNIPNTIAYMKKQWEQFFPGYPFEHRFYDEIISEKYEKEQKLAKSISIISVLAILLCCIGLLGLVLNIVENRNKEIGIHKVNGAKTIEVLGLLNKDFVIWVMLAFIIAIPISRYIMIKWLQNFAYQTIISWWLFILSGIIVLLIALVSVNWHIWLVARRNPLKALRYE